MCIPTKRMKRKQDNLGIEQTSNVLVYAHLLKKKTSPQFTFVGKEYLSMEVWFLDDTHTACPLVVLISTSQHQTQHVSIVNVVCLRSDNGILIDLHINNASRCR